MIKHEQNEEPTGQTETDDLTRRQEALYERVERHFARLRGESRLGTGSSPSAATHQVTGDRAHGLTTAPPRRP
ncbi:hypothetical protein [Streptomyces sp. NPDC002067]